MGPIGAQEMIAIFVLALLLFGPKKLPELGRLLGKGLSEFRRAKSELKSTFESHLNELEKETRATTASTPAVTSHSSADYPYPYEDSHAYDETGYHSPYADSAAVAPYADSAAVAPYADSAAVAPYADSAAVAPYADSAAVDPIVHQAAIDQPYSASSSSVTGTVPRSNGFQQAEPGVHTAGSGAASSNEAKEEHPA